MTSRERQIIKEIRPLLDQGVRGRMMRIYQNLTTFQRKAPKCLFCGGPILHKPGPRKPRKFCSMLHKIIYKRNQSSARKLAAICAFTVFCQIVIGATLTFSWTNGDNPTAVSPPWLTIVSYGISPGVYTNSVTVPYGQTNVVVSNLVSGVRYYASAQHSDGTDTSVASNEANAKTKINPPKNATASAP